MNDMAKRSGRRNARRVSSSAAQHTIMTSGSSLVAFLRPAVNQAVDEWVERRNPLKAIAHQVRKQLELSDMIERIETMLQSQDDV
jgi:hypothetical protein